MGVLGQAAASRKRALVAAMDSDDEVIIVGETSGPSNRAVPTASKRLKREPTQDAAAAGASASSSGAAQQGPTITAEGDFALDNLQCPICIDLLHEPCVGEALHNTYRRTACAWRMGCCKPLTRAHVLAVCSAMRPRVLPQLHPGGGAQQPAPRLPGVQEPVHRIQPW